MLLCDDVLNDLFIYFNGILVCKCSTLLKLENGTLKNLYLFIYINDHKYNVVSQEEHPLFVDVQI